MSDPSPHAHRNVLPIPNVDRPRFTPFDARDPGAVFPPIAPLLPPEGAPNVLVILIDDAGFGSSSAFGGPCQTPVAERLAAGGLKYTRFHTTALCSPTRAALLSGRNHHTVNMGGLTDIATSAPGQTSVRPNTCAPLAEILKLNGYSTAQIGKCHEIPVWETSPMGPFDRWPSSGGGFEYFYGFVAGEVDQYYPVLYENTIPVEPERTPEEGYTLNEDLADHAIAYIQRQKSLMPDRPFFLYYAPGATHAPHQVPPEWPEKYRGRFDQGWDALREETLARQKQLGVVPDDAVLTARHAGIPAWGETDPAMRPVLAREMEVYAGFMEQTDFEIGRVIDTLDELGIFDDTLIFLIIGDNGASAEGTMQGTMNEMIPLTGFSDLETPELMAGAIDRLGSPDFHNHYAVPWAHAMNAPYQWTKQVASHFGGTRNGTIVHWPREIAARGELRHQFHHVIDVAATVLEAAGLPEPTFVHGVQQKPLEGTSMVYTFGDASAPDRHTTQYFEMLTNRGIYHHGWTAVTRHRTPWEVGKRALPAFDDDVWELYDTGTDWTQAYDLAKEHPEKLRELQRIWLIEAVKYNVLPLDDRAAERGIAAQAGRPQLAKGSSQRFFGGMSRLTENSIVSLKNCSYAITAEIDVRPDQPANGVIVALGGRLGGLSLYALDGRLKYHYNFYGLERFETVSETPLPAGAHQVRVEFAYDGGGVGRGGDVTLYLDGAPFGSGRIERTEPSVFSAIETLDIGIDTGTPVSEDHRPRKNRFNGTVKLVQLDAGDLDPDTHLIELQLRRKVAEGTQ